MSLSTFTAAPKANLFINTLGRASAATGLVFKARSLVGPGSMLMLGTAGASMVANKVDHEGIGSKISQYASIPSRFLFTPVNQLAQERSLFAKPKDTEPTVITGQHDQETQSAVEPVTSKGLLESVKGFRPSLPNPSELLSDTKDSAASTYDKIKNTKIEFSAPTVDGVKNKLGGMSVFSMAMTASTAISAAHNAIGIGHNIKLMKHLYADITGVPYEKVKTRDVLFNKNAPEAVKMARTQTMQKYGLGTALNFVNVIAMPKIYGLQNSLGGKGLVATLIASQAMGFAQQFAHVQSEVLPIYATIKEMQIHNQQVSAEHYMTLFVAANPVLQELSPQRAIIFKELADQYAAQNVPIAEAMQRMQNVKTQDGSGKEVTTSQFAQEAKATEQRLISEGLLQPAAVTPAVAQKVAAPTQEIKGAHTARLLGSRQAAQQPALAGRS